MKRKYLYLSILSLLIIGLIVYNMLSEPGIRDLAGDFSEVAFVRNEQNTGPVVRIYAVTVKEGYFKEMEQYGNYMPHTKYGTTRVYFFKKGGRYPSTLRLEGEDLSGEDFRDCIAVYQKDGMGQVSLERLH